MENEGNTIGDDSVATVTATPLTQISGTSSYIQKFMLPPSAGKPVSLLQILQPSPRGASLATNSRLNTNTDPCGTSGDGSVVPQMEDYQLLKNLVPDLQQQLKRKDLRIEQLENEFQELKLALRKKDSNIQKLERELDKFRSVLEQKASLKELMPALSPLHRQKLTKKQGVSGESSNTIPSEQAHKISFQTYEKDFRSKQLIKDAIRENELLENLSSSQVKEMLEAMYPREYSAGSYVITEGEHGSHLYVSAEGQFEVSKDGVALDKFGNGRAFGELAILYNCKRTATVKALTDAKVWELDRKVFQQVMMKTGLQLLEDNLTFLRSVPLLSKLSLDLLAQISDVLEIEKYPPGAYITRQGSQGDTFYILSEGEVRVTQKKEGSDQEEQLRILKRGDYFGEQALLRTDCRTANVIAHSAGVECLSLDRSSFISLIGDLQELKERDYSQEKSRHEKSTKVSEITEFNDLALDDLEVIATLGVGGFGRVELVQNLNDKSNVFALKCLKKKHILDTQQQQHIFSEKEIMMECRSAFIARFYKTFKDRKYVYMLMEACLGGELWTILRDKGHFDDFTARFYIAGVVEAFNYLHSRGIIYRDLKPENLLLDAKGYLRLVDFGFSKKLWNTNKTWTFCGTPEYVAPEIILNKGHDRAVDYWSLGILMYELLTGVPPFTSTDPMKTYSIILKGIDQIHFPKHMSRTSQSLIKRFCQPVPTERLGYGRNGFSDIRKHRWFQGFDWEGLRQHKLTPPIIPKLNGPADSSNFDIYAKDMDIPPDDLSGWDDDF